MSTSIIIFASITGLFAATYPTFLKLSSTRVSAAIGAMIVSLTAFFINLLIIIFSRIRTESITFDPKTILWLVLAGISAWGIDFFGLVTYSKGLKLTSSFIITASQTIFILLIGVIVLKEGLTLGKIVAILLIVTGLLLLNRFSV